ncbi:MAG: class I SAM-dependent methyltransferase [Verrucomicrobia bacterium]|nr:class I SAM-dependent methyltransferase [Verrucomicrobiota bacterium]
MGLDSEVVRMLLKCQREGVDFSSTLTLGCQHYFPGIKETRQLLAHMDPQGMAAISIASQRPHSGNFWKYLGARQLITLDASDYEGATWVHDLNQPVDLSKFPDRFSTVCDIGTLEHVFNYPQALRNSLELVKPGGTFLGFTTMNNYSGHGFYQFSPELFYRVLTPQNGFAIESVVAMEYGPGFHWYEVTDPEKLGARANLINGYRVLLHVRAKKIRECPILESIPQQSDYPVVWRGESKAVDQAGAVHGSSHSSRAHWLLEHFPGLSRWAESLFYSFWNPKYNFSRNPAFRRIRNKNP